MKVTKLHVAVAAALTGAGGLTVETASAQGLEEIVVTAQRREQNLQEVPISIVAITGDSLTMRGLDNIERMGQAIPNVVITGGGGGTGGTNFRMRGIPNVGTYVDGIWQVSTAGFLTQEFVDIDRVEVLRGPQGTMFGRDSTGGALRIWTKRPAEELGGTITATTGSFSRRDVRASIDLPLGDKLLTKWTAANMYRDGYITSLTTGEKGGGIDQQVYRGDIVWAPTDKLDFRFNYQVDQSSFTEPRVQDAMFRTYDDPNPNWGKILVGLPEFYTYVGTDFRGNPVEPFFNPVNQVAGHPGGRVGKWQNRSNIATPNSYRTEQASIETNWDITDRMSLLSWTAAVKQDQDNMVDWDNSQYDLVLDMNRSKLDMFSQEIQLTGSRDKFDWLVGVYYWDQRTLTRNGRWQANEFQKGLFDVNNVLNSPACNPPGGVPAGFTPCQAIWNSAVAGSYDVLPIAEQDGWALFGEATIHLSDSLDLTIGVRQHDQSGYTQNRAPIPGVTAPKPLDPYYYHIGGDPFAGTKVGVPNAFQFDKLTSRLALQKQFSDNVMGYLSYSEGFNSGGVSAPIIRGIRTEFPFKPSTLKNTEIGIRTDLAGGKLRFNATVFNTIWADLQAAGVVYDPITGEQVPTLVTTNVGEAEAKGAEFELMILPTDNFLISLGLGTLDTGYTKIAPGTMAGHMPLDSGTEFQQAPDSSYTIGLQHTASTRAGGTWTSRLDYNYQGQFWRSEPFLRVSGYAAIPDNFEESGDWGVLNMRFTYEPASANWQASIFGTNLANKYMINSGFFHGIWGYDFATVGRPREAGASLTFRF